MSDDTEDALRQAEETASRHAADQDAYPVDRADIHRLFDTIDDDGLIIAAWLMELAQLITIPPAKRFLRASLAEHLVAPAFDPNLVQRWINFINALVTSAPPSWFDTPERQEQLRLWLQPGAIRGFGHDVSLPGGDDE